MTVRDYIEAFQSQSYPALFSSECQGALANVREAYGHLPASRVMYELRLGDPTPVADFGFRTHNEVLGHHWLGFDYASYCRADAMVPCTYLDRAPLDDERCMTALLGQARWEALREALVRLEDMLRGRETRLDNVGAMDSRSGHADYARVEVRVRGLRQLMDVIQALPYAGDTALVGTTLADFEEYTFVPQYLLGFDCHQDGISRRIGVHFFPLSSVADTRRMMRRLIERGLCVPEKAAAVVDWRRDPLPEGVSTQDIHHIKFQFEGEGIVSCKAYLQQAERFRFFWQ